MIDPEDRFIAVVMSVIIFLFGQVAAGFCLWQHQLLAAIIAWLIGGWGANYYYKIAFGQGPPRPPEPPQAPRPPDSFYRGGPL